MKKKTISQLTKKADKIFSEYIRKRDKGTCISCGVRKDWKEMQAGHYVSRSNFTLRYYPNNVNAQCVACNVFKHGNYISYRKALVEKIGEEEVKYMENFFSPPIPISGNEKRALLESIIEKYGGKL